MEERIKRVAGWLPELARIAAAAHTGAPRQVVVVAVLTGWCGLAGVTGWTPEMIRAAEAEVSKAG